MPLGEGKLLRILALQLAARPALRYACAAILILAPVSLVLAVRTAVIIPNAGVLYFLPVVASALWLGTGPAILALSIAVAAIGYYYVPIDADVGLSIARLLILFFGLMVGAGVGHLARREKQRTEAMAEAAESERRRFQAVFENAPVGIALLRGPSFLIELRNPAYQAFAPGRRFLGKTVADAWPEMADEALPILNRVYHTGEPYHVVERPGQAERQPGAGLSEVYLTVSYVPLKDEIGAVEAIIVLVVDSTRHVLARRSIEEERERAQQFAAEAEELAAEREEHLERLQELDRLKDDFLSSAAHELKTPLTSLRGFAQTLLRSQEKHGAADPERLTKALTAIDQQSQKLARLVNRLLDVSSFEDGQLALELEQVDLARIVEDVVAAARLQTAAHSLTVEAPTQLNILADQLRIEQVVANLVDNAMRFSPDGGSIEVTIAIRDGQAEMSVRDHGMGIPPDKIDRIFERFFGAHQVGAISGLGLGLHISNRIAMLHGGRIEAECPPDGGSRFVVTLPLAPTIEPTGAK